MVMDLSKKYNLSSTYFELVTALGCVHFREAECEVAVIEVGIGGRLDATNVISTDLSVITSVQYDHMNLLGNTLEDIAREKCGIFRQNVPALIGPEVPLHIAEVTIYYLF